MCPQEATQRKKRSSTSQTKPVPEGDHRKRRRNRTTQSCLNCHTSKRMCDRKRPACARCTQLGLTGLCVYEVDDPNQRTDAADESARLLKRVAELEGVIRELKHKPNPKRSDTSSESDSDHWMLRPDDYMDNVKPTASSSQGSLSPMTPYNAYPITTHLKDRASSPSSSRVSYISTSPLGSPSPILTPCDEYSHTPYVHSELVNELDVTSMFLPYQCYNDLDPGYSADLAHIHAQPSPKDHQLAHCGCLNDSNGYNLILDLSMRLRKASESLSQSSRHHHMGQCAVMQRISEMDMFTTNALAGMHYSPEETISPPPFTPPDRQSSVLASAIAQTTNMNSPHLMHTRGGVPPTTISPGLLNAMRSHQWESMSTVPDSEVYMTWDNSRSRI